MARKRKKRGGASRPVTFTPLSKTPLPVAIPNAVEPEDASHTVGGPDGSAIASKSKKTKKKKKMTHTQFIGHYHALTKNLEAANATGNKVLASEIQEQLEKLGGITSYQRASVRGEQVGGFTSQWLVKKLPRPSTDSKLRLLDVGALWPNYDKHKWIEATAIDLNSNHSAVQQIDFFEYESETKFDAICLSLVINFVGEPRQRGEMLRKACRMLNKGGHLFLVLPRACVDNSRYTTCDSVKAVGEALGLEQIEQHLAPKLVYFLFKLERPAAHKNPDVNVFKRTLRLSGEKRNNFAILL
eukprot:m.148564 g.148564  ORF g.148564 m.148564 type:complete len:299 (+) comp30605_c0_seq1:174-1070(+)